MTERADQLVLDYVNKAADAAHGVLHPRQRIDFVARLRERIDTERAGLDDPAAVAELLTRLGDPAALVRRELRGLTGVTVPRPGGPLAAPVPDGAGPPPPHDPSADDPGTSAPHRSMRGHPYASPGDRETEAQVPAPRPEAAPSGPVDSGKGSTGTDGAGSAGTDGSEIGSGGAGAAGAERADGPGSAGADGPGSAEAGGPEIAVGSAGTDGPDGGSGGAGAAGPDGGAEGAEADGPEVVAGASPEKRGSGASQRAMPPGVAQGMREAEALLARKRARRQARGRADRPGLRTPRPRPDVVPGESDARSVLRGHPRETVAMALLALAGLLIPFPFAPIAIFQIPVLVWAVAALVVTFCETWHTSDKVFAVATPIVGYTLGGAVVAVIRSRDDFSRVIDEFFAISGLMFALGAAWGVFWLAYRLLNPPARTDRRLR
ncbi:hypothetical protein FHS43_006059 [Streptosporangium becharense]|uniref:Uncharacterized protein n=1 Tax=Streptosporangium becharense TaxID=1816182 RepID=A0A7W9IHL3_9ACTN|nr:hypothetical protein [Streptosporangium becharense]MBB2914747.1 hypothetical protein [Streptosporangium becharense]MBB5820852.1 hypothetical protein [Streptosporangium becharense]